MLRIEGFSSCVRDTFNQEDDLVLVEEGGEEAEEGEGGEDGHGVGRQGVGPRQRRVHPGHQAVSETRVVGWISTRLHEVPDRPRPG